LEVQVGFFLHTPLNVFPAFRSPLDGLSVEIGLRCTQFDLEFSDVAMALFHGLVEEPPGWVDDQ